MNWHTSSNPKELERGTGKSESGKGEKKDQGLVNKLLTAVSTMAHPVWDPSRNHLE